MKQITPRTITLIQLLFYFSFSYTLFFMYDIWKLGDSMLGYLVYFASFPLMRLIYVPIATLFVIHNKITLLLKLSFFSNIVMALSIIFIFPNLDNVIVVSLLYALFTVTFTTGFHTGFNYVISTYMDEKKLDKYFYTTGFYQNIMDTVLPIALGLIIIFIAKDMAYVILIIISIATILYLGRFEKVDTGNQSIKFRELFAKDDSSDVPKKIAMLHLIYILAYNGFIQVFEIYGTSYLYTVATDDLELAVYKVISVLGIGLILATKTRLKPTEQFWVLLATALTVLTILLGFIGMGSVVGFIAVASLLLMYIFQSSFTSLSFRLMSGENTKNRIIVLFQREMLRAVGKSVTGVIVLLVSAEGIFSKGFYILTVIVLVLLISTVALYKVIESYIASRAT